MGDLRAMVGGIITSGKSLSWAILILATLMYIYSAVLMQLLVYSLTAGLDDAQTLFVETYFGSVLTSMSVLTQCITGGKDWGDISEALREISIFYDLIFTSYVIFAVLGVLNIVTGIFVDSATKNVQKDADHVMLHEMSNRMGWMQELAKFFEGVDVEREGHITLEDFRQYLDSGQVQAYLRSIGLHVDVHNAAGLFNCIDFDGDGYLTMEQFVDGCSRIAGNARQLDLARTTAYVKEAVRQLMLLHAKIDSLSEFDSESEGDGEEEERDQEET
eukprot:NODE_2417_length_939_cov_116.584842.p1 GENE.NODE_2417_length_939_cov_116.584842~~NODE_2417_length_939_cov_116.584842.p1  ORF type:complete len:274 (+),score=109.34 NODE_2417_length_939_cov_116.584842:3-824(+)